MAQMLSGAAALAMLTATAAQAQSWTHDEGEARATLPSPRSGGTYQAAALSCEEQEWTLRLHAPAVDPRKSREVALRLSIGPHTFRTSARENSNGLAMGIEPDALAALKAGRSLSIASEGMTSPITFDLAGSRAAILAADGYCTPRHMPSYEAISLMTGGPAVVSATMLRAEDMDEFRAATASEPVLRAAGASLNEGSEVVFAELCGSSWYYGGSGCGMAGYASMRTDEAGVSGDWRLIFESEGAHLYIDREFSTLGWPEILALPRRAGASERRWAYDGKRYVPAPDRQRREPLDAMVEDPSRPVEGLRR